MSSDNRNIKKGQNHAPAEEQEEGIKANTTNTSDLEVNPLSAKKKKNEHTNLKPSTVVFS